MRTVNIHEAKTQLSRLVDQAIKGEPFVIAKAGKPLVKVTRLFDRILVAQSMIEGITLLTTDPLLARYPGPVRQV